MAITAHLVGITESRELEFTGRSLEIFCLFCGNRSLGGKEKRV
jgi:hypothetical protein